jgi:hypothetical protein
MRAEGGRRRDEKRKRLAFLPQPSSHLPPNVNPSRSVSATAGPPGYAAGVVTHRKRQGCAKSEIVEPTAKKACLTPSWNRQWCAEKTPAHRRGGRGPPPEDHSPRCYRHRRLAPCSKIGGIRLLREVATIHTIGQRPPKKSPDSPGFPGRGQEAFSLPQSLSGRAYKRWGQLCPEQNRLMSQESGVRSGLHCACTQYTPSSV